MKTKIAVAFNHSFKSIEAELVGIHGIPCAVHRSLNKSGWSVSSIERGVALTSKAQSKARAIESCLGSVSFFGVEKTLTQLSKFPLVPAVETLEAYVAPVKETTLPADIDGIVKLIGDRVDLNEGERLAVRNALNSRTGRLKAKAPSDDWSKAAWNGLNPNPWKIQFSACFLRGEPAALLSKLSKHSWPVALDKDLSTLRALGVA